MSTDTTAEALVQVNNHSLNRWEIPDCTELTHTHTFLASLTVVLIEVNDVFALVYRFQRKVIPQSESATLGGFAGTDCIDVGHWLEPH